MGSFHHLLQCQAVLLPQGNTVDKEDLHGGRNSPVGLKRASFSSVTSGKTMLVKLLDQVGAVYCPGKVQ